MRDAAYAAAITRGDPLMPDATALPPLPDDAAERRYALCAVHGALRWVPLEVGGILRNTQDNSEVDVLEIHAPRET